MSNPLSLTNLSALKFNEDIEEFVSSVSRPLIDNIGITHFGCVKIFNNSTMLRIANNKDWTRKYFEKAFYNDPILYGMGNIAENKTHISILTGTPTNEHFASMYYEYNIWNFLLIYEKFKDHGTLWFFGTRPGNTKIFNYYVNNIDIFKMFILYSKEKFSHILNEHDSKKLIKTNVNLLNYKNEENLNLSSLINEIKIKAFHLKDDVYLSQREAECLFHISKGKTLKEIALSTKLSPRTVETYLNNAKKKAGCHTKSQIIKVFNDGSHFLRDTWEAQLSSFTRGGEAFFNKSAH